MLGIAIEIGSYSVKFLTYKVERKKVILLKSDEVIIDDVGDSLDNDHLMQTQFQIIKEYLSHLEVEFQVLITLPGEIISHRFLTLPVKNKRKASLMLPFQIEEDLPNSLNLSHWADSIELVKENCEATVGIVRKDLFEEYFHRINQYGLTPLALTSDVSALENFIQDNQANFPDHFCILNIGHESSRSFYFKQGKLVSVNHSYIAGKAITEAISQNYSISIEEANLYKHQNGFLHLEELYDKLDDNQREFAKMMDATLTPLISEMKRWDIGYRVEHGQPIKHVYICGGSSNIKNMDNYLSSKLNVVVERLNSYQYLNSNAIDFDEKVRSKFSIASILAYNAPAKSRLINFLNGEYSIKSGEEMPLEAFTLVTIRAMIVSLVIGLFLLGNIFIIQNKIKKAKRAEAALFKNPNISSFIDRNTINLAKRDPMRLVNKLEDREKMIMQEIKVIQSSLQMNALYQLNEIAPMVSGKGVQIQRFTVERNLSVFILFMSEQVDNLKNLEQLFKQDSSRKWFTTLAETEKTLEVSGKGSQR